MAEIKSTMDLVMERMARMTANTAEPVNNDEDNEKIGMKAAAAYLDNTLADLTQELAQHPPEAQKAVFSGATKILLRNVLLPRDERLQERSDSALNGIITIAQALNAAEVSQVCAELQQILQQYNQHKDQVTQQVEEAMRGQLEQQYAGRGVDPSQIRASMHPKYNEEMSKVHQDLNGQYIQAMDQRKDMIMQQLGLA